MTGDERIRAEIFHRRKGPVKNAFRYSVDYVLLDRDRAQGPSLFSRNRGNLMAGMTATTAVLRGRGAAPPGRVRCWRGRGWRMTGCSSSPSHACSAMCSNPVSFRLAQDASGQLRAVIAEVTNTSGDRHSCLCHREGRGPVTREDTFRAQKISHVSPFQPVAGRYDFRFDIGPDRTGIWIDYTAPGRRALHQPHRPRLPLTDAGILASVRRRPFGSRRVLALIHWQALDTAVAGLPGKARALPVDVGCRASVARAAEQLGDLDGIVFLAGSTGRCGRRTRMRRRSR